MHIYIWKYYKRDEEVQNSHGIWGSGMDAGGCADEHWQF